MDDAPNTPLDALLKAAQIVGSQAKLAKAIGKSGQSYISMLVYRLKNEPGARIDAEVCPAIEAATNGEVTRQMLRPDFAWGADPVPGTREAA